MRLGKVKKTFIKRVLSLFKYFDQATKTIDQIEENPPAAHG